MNENIDLTKILKNCPEGIAPGYKKEKFNPYTLKPFDKVLVRVGTIWLIELFSFVRQDKYGIRCQCIRSNYDKCIPYTDDTKHLVGTTENAPEYYRYWED